MINDVDIENVDGAQNGDYLANGHGGKTEETAEHTLEHYLHSHSRNEQEFQ